MPDADRLCQRRTLCRFARCPSRIRRRRRLVRGTLAGDGSVHAELPAGTYKVTLQKPGFGAKSVQLEIAPGREPFQLRLLADGLLGYAWPKWLKAGEKSEFRVHSVEPYHLSLWRYGIHKELVREIGWFDEHGPRATMQITPDGDYTQTGVEWNKHGYANPLLHQYVRRTRAIRAVLLSCPHQVGRRVFLSLDRGA